MTEITFWFQSNLLSLNYNKKHFIKFQIKKQNEAKTQIVVPNSINSNINSTKFSGLIIDNSLSWKDHITAITSKLNKAYYTISCWNRFCPWIHWKWSISCTHTMFCHMVLYFGAICTHISQTVFSKFKKELLQIPAVVICAVIYLNNCEYFHYHLSTFSPCLSL